MLVEIISKYLQSNKRLVVPNLGAFIVKTTENKILFSNLMKGDDGVLRRLLVENGIKELEAAGLIDRFVFEINYRLQNEGECAIGGLGRLVAKSNGAVAFEYNPSVSGANLEGDMPARKAAEKAAAQPAIEPNKQETEPESESESQESNNEISPAEEPSKPRRTAAADVYGDNTEASRRVRPEKYTKGLRYGKGAKVVTGRESATARRSKNGDVIIKIAILVALLAIAVLLYGLYNDWRAGKLFSDDVPVIDNSEIYEEVPQSAEEGIRNPDLDYLTPKN